jgi:hypothetical protein
MGQPRQDVSQPAADVPVGTIAIRVLDSQGSPVENAPVVLRVLRSSIEQGDKRDELRATTDQEGNVVFQGQSSNTEFSYTVLVERPPANFSVGQFRLLDNQGHRVVLHVYDVTRDPLEAMIAAEGVIAIRPQDNVFVVDMLYRVYNLSPKAWVPSDFYLDLPRGWKAFTGQESGDTRFEDGGERGATLKGTFNPGSHEVGFRFHLENQQDETFRTTLPLFPRTVDIRVIADRSPGMGLEVAGFPPAEAEESRTGQPVLFARKGFMKDAKGSPSTLSISLSGLPTRGPGRFYVVGLAALIAGIGIHASTRRKGATPQIATDDRETARKLLLNELVALESARERELLGPRNYDQARSTLLDHLARLEIGEAPASSRPKSPGKA